MALAPGLVGLWLSQPVPCTLRLPQPVPPVASRLGECAGYRVGEPEGTGYRLGECAAAGGEAHASHPAPTLPLGMECTLYPQECATDGGEHAFTFTAPPPLGLCWRAAMHALVWGGLAISLMGIFYRDNYEAELAAAGACWWGLNQHHNASEAAGGGHAALEAT